MLSKLRVRISMKTSFNMQQLICNEIREEQFFVKIFPKIPVFYLHCPLVQN